MPLTPTTPNTCDASFRTQHVELLADNERMRARLDALETTMQALAGTLGPEVARQQEPTPFRFGFNSVANLLTPTRGREDGVELLPPSGEQSHSLAIEEEDAGPAAPRLADSHLERIDALLANHVSLEDLDNVLDKNIPASHKLWDSIPMPIFVSLIVLAWLFGGAGLYAWLNDWPFWQSYYYAVNVGYSIGFGALVEKNDLSRLLSVLMICLGAGAVGGLLGFFVQTSLEASDDYAAMVRKRENKRYKIGFDNDGDGDVDMKDYILGCSQYVKDVYKNHKVRINCFIALLIWISAGVVFGMVNQEWSFVTSLYFAVSALSTGGLKSVNTRVTDDGVTLLDGKGGNGFVSFFNGFYAMTGVPVFGVALGQFAGVFVDQYIAKKEEAAMHRSLTRDEYDFVRTLDKDDDMLSFGEFLALELLRLSKIDHDTVLRIKREFDLRDKDGSGEITWEEVQVYQHRAAFLRKSRQIHEHELKKQHGLTKKQAKALTQKKTDEEIITHVEGRVVGQHKAPRVGTELTAAGVSTLFFAGGACEPETKV